MDAFDQPIQTLVLSLPLAEDLVTDPKQDYIFDASALTINDTFVTTYSAFLEGIESKAHSRVLVVQNEFFIALSRNPCSCTYFGRSPRSD